MASIQMKGLRVNTLMVEIEGVCDYELMIDAMSHRCVEGCE